MRVYATSHTSNVAYVTDASSSSYQDLAGSNIWDNAVNVNGTNDCLPTHTSPCTYHSVTFTDVSASIVTSVSSFSGFDTVLLYQVCDIGNQTTLMSALNAFLTNGGKVVIFDGDWCAPNDGGAPNYSTFKFPFNSSNPGPQGADKTLTFVESESLPATLARGLAVGDGGTGGLGGSNDAVGDSNTFTSFDSHWCSALEGVNALDKQGIQEAYARTDAGGLVVYNGQDFAVSFGPNIYQKTVFDNIIDQPFNPDSLPCNVVASGITLAPSTATNIEGTSHTVTATVLNSTHFPIPDKLVTFNVTSGPNNGKSGTGTTNSTGMANFTYTGTGGVGTDSLVASFRDANNTLRTSNTVTKEWTASTTTTTTTTTITETVTTTSCTSTTTLFNAAATVTVTSTTTSTLLTNCTVTSSTSTSTSTTTVTSTTTSCTATTTVLASAVPITTTVTSTSTVLTSCTVTTTAHGIPEFGAPGFGASTLIAAAVGLFAIVFLIRGIRGRLTTNAHI